MEKPRADLKQIGDDGCGRFVGRHSPRHALQHYVFDGAGNVEQYQDYDVNGC